MVSTPETFQLAVDAYAEVAGRVPRNPTGRCAAIIEAGALNYAAFALATGDPEHTAVAVAAAWLNP